MDHMILNRQPQSPIQADTKSQHGNADAFSLLAMMMEAKHVSPNLWAFFSRGSPISPPPTLPPPSFLLQRAMDGFPHVPMPIDVTGHNHQHYHISRANHDDHNPHNDNNINPHTDNEPDTVKAKCHSTHSSFEEEPAIGHVADEERKDRDRRVEDAKVHVRVEQLLQEYSQKYHTAESRANPPSNDSSENDSEGIDDEYDDDSSQTGEEVTRNSKPERITINSLLNPENEVPADPLSTLVRSKMDILNFVSSDNDPRPAWAASANHSPNAPNNEIDSTSAVILSQIAKLNRSIAAHQPYTQCTQPVMRRIPRPEQRSTTSSNPKKRKRASPQQVALLENIFTVEPLPNTATKQRISQELGMTPRRVTIWFQNKRARLKKTGGKEKPKKDPFTFHHLSVGSEDGKLTLSSDGSPAVDLQPSLQRVPRKKRAKRGGGKKKEQL